MLLFLFACTALELLEDVEPEPADCEDRLLVYEDVDGDGYGNEAVVALVCETRSGFVEVGGDCDDGDPTRWADCSGGGGGDTSDTSDTSDTADSGAEDSGAE
jgi:hypothetical protein